MKLSLWVKFKIKVALFFGRSDWVEFNDGILKREFKIPFIKERNAIINQLQQECGGWVINAYEIEKEKLINNLKKDITDVNITI